jgi:hypothetical protein
LILCLVLSLKANFIEGCTYLSTSLFDLNL